MSFQDIEFARSRGRATMMLVGGILTAVFAVGVGLEAMRGQATTREPERDKRSS